MSVQTEIPAHVPVHVKVPACQSE